MTQQQISRLLNVPDKSNRYKLYSLLESLKYEEVKYKMNVVDTDNVITFDPRAYSTNLFWQTNKKSEQKAYAIISKYLSTMNRDDIKRLCDEFGQNMVKSVLVDKYKKIYKKGYIAISGMDIPLSGKFSQNKIYKQLLGMINDC